MTFNDIFTRNDLADFLGIKRGQLTNILYFKHVDSLYKTFSIPKKNGSERIIHAPNHKLKVIQKRLANALWTHQETIWRTNNIVPSVSHAFQKKKSIITNSVRHRNKRIVINYDLKDFFTSFNFGRVRGFFIKNRYWQLSEEISTVIAQLTCFKGALPQGAPTSPIITNMISNIMDIGLIQLAKKYRLNYTRYADDLTFSTNDIKFASVYETFFKEFNNIVNRAGFTINSQKTRLVFSNNRQEVTGLIVNKRLSVGRDYCKQTEAMANNLYSKGEFTIDDKQGSISQLEGRFSFIDQLERYNNIIDHDQHSVHNLRHRERKYQEFLFYKYFCANPKPLIITEGKTDIIHIKSALKALYLQYPNLISRNNNLWNYNVSFLNRSPRLKYFFDFQLDGADSMVTIYNLYSGQGRANINYCERFSEHYGMIANYPVILLFDNELEKKNLQYASLKIR